MLPRTPWTHWPNLNTVTDPSFPLYLLASLTHLCSGDGSKRYYGKHPSFAKNKADGVHYIAAAHIMDDDLESAEAGLASGDSSFHKVCYTIPRGCRGSRLIGFGIED